MKIYDILGSQVTVLVNEAKPPGNYEVYKERDYNKVTNEDRDLWYAKDNKGNVTQFRIDEKDNESSWWDNPLNPLSWFN